ncbi:SDR family oxidoreductase [Microbulbifer sp. OS29]|uniref:SDR family oxidoreductase n=1 Tax=Microbulbifer okhotskensis TaxID=2926617 RepID=A0A9X2EPF9_9GAMM|nr:SDR family oxidoreductase [Microbulbifer okhotskensis]MCO1335411.1 SDR family oxidoreductase [Microbulbifer okhotskensis]
MSISIEGKVALVTGANRGIGKAIVESFLTNGAKKVYLAVRTPETTSELVNKYGDQVVTLKLDVTKTESVEAAAEAIQDLDILVNNAGILVPADPLSDHVETSLQQELEVNTFGLIRVAKAFAPQLEKNKGALVQMNSVVSLRTFPHVSTYSASKAASYAITQALRETFLERGVQVLSVHPGPIKTDMAKQAGLEDGESPSAVAQGIIDALANGDFHLFPDAMAQTFEAAYQSFSDSVITADFSE